MSYTSDTGAFAFFQTSKIRSGEGSREVVYREDEEKMRLAKLVLSVTAFAVSTVFAGDSLLNFDKTDPTATCILTAESPSPKYVLILFPGGDGRVAAHLTVGKIFFGKRNTFLIRSRLLLADNEFATVSTDASSGQKRFSLLLDRIRQLYPHASVWLVSTSRGTLAVAQVAGKCRDRLDGVVFTASMKELRDIPLDAIKVPKLFVHHVSDGCKSTPYDAARELAAKLNADFVTVSGGKTKGKPCQAFAYHGFNGREEKVVDEIKNWIKARAE